MNSGRLEQGAELRAVQTPDWCSEGTYPHIAGQSGCKRITVTQLAGPMGFYDCAEIEFDDPEIPNQIIPLHQCDFIQMMTA